MIYEQLNNTANKNLSGKIKKVIRFVQENDLKQFGPGSHVIDGDSLFVNILSYETTAPENRFWEAHKEYLDIHVPIEKEEQIDLAFLSDMQVKGYEKVNDFVSMDGEKRASLVMKPGEFLVCFPEDAHRTAVAVNGHPEKIKKAVFKVKI